MRPDSTTGGVVLETRGEILTVASTHAALMKRYGSGVSSLRVLLAEHVSELPDPDNYMSHFESVECRLPSAEAGLARLSLKYGLLATTDLGETLRIAEIIDDFRAKGGEIST